MHFLERIWRVGYDSSTNVNECGDEDPLLIFCPQDEKRAGRRGEKKRSNRGIA
jgi:hypothetical protein